MAYCTWLSENEGLVPCFTGKGRVTKCDFSASGYGLPTDAKWEYAARGGQASKGTIYAGSDDPDGVAWYAGNSDDQIHPVGRREPNELWLYDMSFNLYGWCWDWYGSCGSGPATDPTGVRYGSKRVIRGGSWLKPAEFCRSANRSRYDPSARTYDIGFRVARWAD